MNPSLELSCRHPGDRYPFHGGLGHCVVNSYNPLNAIRSFKMKKSIFIMLALALMATPVLAADEATIDNVYSSYSTEELAAMRGTLRDATVEERTMFQTEWQSRVLEMDATTRQEYMGRPANALADGAGIRSRLGRNTQADMPGTGGMAGGQPGSGSAVADGTESGLGGGAMGRAGMPQSRRGMMQGGGGANR
jgi:hypothetical protein